MDEHAENETMQLDSPRNTSPPRKKRRSSRLSLSDRIVSEARTLVENGIIPAESFSGSVEASGPFAGLPTVARKLFADQRDITDLYDWQKECLEHGGIAEGKNVILSLPTSGGKTLIAEILILRQLLIEENDAILVLPFVSIVQEKVKSIVPFGLAMDFLVEEYAGSKGRFPPIRRRKKRSLYICTIEKGQSLVNSLIESDQMRHVGLVVLDELHMLGEGSGRGASLEQTVSKIMYCARESDFTFHKPLSHATELIGGGCGALLVGSPPVSFSLSFSQ